MLRAFGWAKRSVYFALLVCGLARAEQPPSITSGTVEFVPTDAEPTVAERFRQTRHTYTWEARRLTPVSTNFDVYDVTFPSPVKDTRRGQQHGPLRILSADEARPAAGRDRAAHSRRRLSALAAVLQQLVAARRGGPVCEDAVLRSAARSEIAGPDGEHRSQGDGRGHDAGSARHSPGDGLARRPTRSR